ncbi:hypothetical protein BRD08_07335 [Halobacteriales archaeon SW_10_66_29]|nr:MAG: hypothetical protein BRD08_07335 [Halobacteriales archaeon SW_10_66_29]
MTKFAEEVVAERLRTESKQKISLLLFGYFSHSFVDHPELHFWLAVLARECWHGERVGNREMQFPAGFSPLADRRRRDQDWSGQGGP